MHFKGVHCVAVVSCHENNHRHVPAAQGVQHAETVHFRHLHVKKDQVWLMLQYAVDSLLSVRKFSNHSDFWIGGEQGSDPLASQRLVIHDDCANLHLTASPYFPSATSSSINWNGRARFTTSPPRAPFCISKRSAAP